MATQPEYTAVANAVLKTLDDFIRANVPDVMGYQQKALAAMPAVAGSCAKTSIDTLDAFRAHHKP